MSEEANEEKKLSEEELDRQSEELTQAIVNNDRLMRGLPPLENPRDALTNRRRKELNKSDVVKYMNDGYTLDEIGEKLGVARMTVLNYVREIEKERRTEYLGDIQAARVREIEYVLRFRADVKQQWDTKLNKDQSKKSQYAAMVLALSDRYAKLAGLDAPLKTQDWTNKDYESYLNEYAKERNISLEEAQEQVIAEVERVLEENGRKIANDDTGSRGTVSQPKDSTIDPTEMDADSPEGRENIPPTDGV